MWYRLQEFSDWLFMGDTPLWFVGLVCFIVAVGIAVCVL